MKRIVESRNIRKPAFVLCTLILLFPVISGCASFQKRTKADIKHDAIQRIASPEAFKKAEPLLLQLKPGDSVEATGLTWSVNNINNADEIVGQVSYSNGWIECMSGGISQAFYKFGALYGRSRQTAYGMHVFGYVTGSLNIVPRYLLKTEATIILPSEYDKLEENKTRDIGWTWTPGKNTKTYLKNIRVKEVQAVNFIEPVQTRNYHAEVRDVNSYVNKYLTPVRFRETEQVLSRLAKGLRLMDVINVLDGVLVLKTTAEDFMVLGVKGFLNLTEEYRAWSKSTPEGVFTIWSFGYVEQGTEVPKLALIFRNAEVFKVVPYGTRQELEKHFFGS